MVDKCCAYFKWYIFIKIFWVHSLHHVLVCMHALLLSCVWLFETLAGQAPLSVGLSKNTGVGCHFFLQGIFPTQGLTYFSCVFWIDRWILYHCATWKALSIVCEYLQYPQPAKLRKYISMYNVLMWDKCVWMVLKHVSVQMLMLNVSY